MIIEDLNVYIKQLRKEKETFKRIIEWNKFAQKEKNNLVKRFIFRWISFNGLYSAVYSFIHSQEKADNAGDLDKIIFFCNNFILKKEDLASKIYSKILKDIFLSKIKKRKDKHLKGNLKVLESSAPDIIKVKSLIIVSYKIRCRLFHGEKDPLLDVGREVIDAADNIIEPLMEFIINLKS